ncbi:MAG: hypothetical protein V3U20_07205, partial [Thermoplasmata archaeon]
MMSEEAEAAPGSITIDSTTVTLTDDADTNGICNIGDQITVTAWITNNDADGVPPPETTVTVDLTDFGGGAAVALILISSPEESGVSEQWEVVYTIVDSPGTPDSGAGTATATIA